MGLLDIADDLVTELEPLRFGPPVTHVYNPLAYAREAYRSYVERFGDGRGRIVMMGMNPGPWGMAQTGVPFGEVELVRDWLGIDRGVQRPAVEHPKRPIMGFDCHRREVSGQRIWGWARERFGSPERFFAEFFVVNYCPLVFMEESGRNRTPDKLPKSEREPLLAACDEALRRTMALLEPRHFVGVGRFAVGRAKRALGGDFPNLPIGEILHPSPASPKANRGWAAQADAQLADLGLL